MLSISKLVLRINDEDIYITLKEAEELYKELRKLFKTKEVTQIYPTPYIIYRDRPYWQSGQITCDTSGSKITKTIWSENTSDALDVVVS